MSKQATLTPSKRQCQDQQPTSSLLSRLYRRWSYQQLDDGRELWRLRAKDIDKSMNAAPLPKNAVTTYIDQLKRIADVSAKTQRTRSAVFK